MDSMTLATWVIALATVVNIVVAGVTAFVYLRMSRQINQQIELAGQQAELAKAAFRISNRPYLTIRAVNGGIFEPDQFKAEIHLLSLGSAPAKNVLATMEPTHNTLRCGEPQRFGPFLLQPHSDQAIPIRWVVNREALRPAYPMTLTVFLAFEDIEDTSYSLSARYDWDYEQGVFVPVKLGEERTRNPNFRNTSATRFVTAESP
jgi:hypothetical protein